MTSLLCLIQSHAVKNRDGYGKCLVCCDSRYLRSLLDADGRFPRRQEAETMTFTDATGASRSALVSHEEVQAWADECHDCQLVFF